MSEWRPEIPVRNISQTEVDSKLECNICLEDFACDEPVRQLICEHVFHEPCIEPWLRQHSSCPTCRVTFNREGIVDVQSVYRDLDLVEWEEVEEESLDDSSSQSSVGSWMHSIEESENDNARRTYETGHFDLRRFLGLADPLNRNDEGQSGEETNSSQHDDSFQYDASPQHDDSSSSESYIDVETYSEENLESRTSEERGSVEEEICSRESVIDVIDSSGNERNVSIEDDPCSRESLSNMQDHSEEYAESHVSEKETVSRESSLNVSDCSINDLEKSASEDRVSVKSGPCNSQSFILNLYALDVCGHTSKNPCSIVEDNCNGNGQSLVDTECSSGEGMKRHTSDKRMFDDEDLCSRASLKTVQNHSKKDVERASRDSSSRDSQLDSKSLEKSVSKDDLSVDVGCSDRKVKDCSSNEKHIFEERNSSEESSIDFDLVEEDNSVVSKTSSDDHDEYHTSEEYYSTDESRCVEKSNSGEESLTNIEDFPDKNEEYHTSEEGYSVEESNFSGKGDILDSEHSLSNEEYYTTEESHSVEGGNSGGGSLNNLNDSEKNHTSEDEFSAEENTSNKESLVDVKDFPDKCHLQKDFINVEHSKEVYSDEAGPSVEVRLIEDKNHSNDHQNEETLSDEEDTADEEIYTDDESQFDNEDSNDHDDSDDSGRESHSDKGNNEDHSDRESFNEEDNINENHSEEDGSYIEDEFDEEEHYCMGSDFNKGKQSGGRNCSDKNGCSGAMAFLRTNNKRSHDMTNNSYVKNKSLDEKYFDGCNLSYENSTNKKRKYDTEGSVSYKKHSKYNKHMISHRKIAMLRRTSPSSLTLQ